MSADAVIRIKPFSYIHVLDNNTNVTRVEVGPATLTRQDHEKLVAGPEAMIMVPPRHYCIIANPVERDPKTNGPIIDKFGQVKIRWGDEEIRFEQDPFPLFPGEKLYGKVSPLQVVAPNTALRLRAIRDFTEVESEVSRHAGDEWLFNGPGTYIPRVEVQVVEIVRAIVIKPQQALKLRARRELKTRDGVERKAGEEWLVRTPGAYMPAVDEELIDTVQAYVLTPLKALHLRANRTFVDVFGTERKAGEEWLVTSLMAEVYIADVYETVVGEVPVTTLNNRQWAVVLDPWGKDSRPQLGKRELRKGEVTFFLMPGERLESGVQNTYVLGEGEALLLRAKEEYNVSAEEKHAPGDRWMVYGPCDYIPPVEVEVVERRLSIALDSNEGIYVRDIKSGKVRVEMGHAYMLKPNEELWPKDLPAIVEELLRKDVRMAEAGVTSTLARDKTRVVAYRAPHNSVVQVYDYKEKRARVVFGPELVTLGPDEHFTVISLSGGKPKQPHLIKTLAMLLGPDFMTDIVVVETSDHARLSLKLSYNWHFEVLDHERDGARLFQVPDFVGDSCKAIAARVRGAVAAVSFEYFHRNSAKLIRDAVFGGPENNKFVFKSNNLVITNVDIQNVEPVDQKTRDSLQKSVQLAIEITTKSQEATARHEAERLEQEAKGRLDRQKLHDEAESEKSRKALLSLQAQSAAVETTGQATAEARARAESAQIEGEAAVKQAELKAQANKIKAEAEIKTVSARQEQELTYQGQLNEMEVHKARELASIESKKFKDIVKAIGPKTIQAIAQAGPETQLKLLSGLGLQSVLITDGNSPINLFNTAAGLVSKPQPQ